MTLARKVHLFGGPYHGQDVVVPIDSDHVHLNGFFPVEDNPAERIVRKGTYSQVSGPGNRDNFEWDGWVKDD